MILAIRGKDVWLGYENEDFNRTSDGSFSDTGKCKRLNTTYVRNGSDANPVSRCSNALCWSKGFVKVRVQARAQSIWPDDGADV